MDLKSLAEAIGIFTCDGTIYSTNKCHVLEVRGKHKELKYYKTKIKPIIYDG